MRLVLRRGTVVQAGSADGPEQALVVDVPGRGERPAVADVDLVGGTEVGDEVVVNTQAADLALGSGGFDVVHVNLTRGLDGDGVPGAHVMKLNYTSLQHAIMPVEPEQPLSGPGDSGEARVHADPLAQALHAPVGVFGLHGQLAPIAWAVAQARPGVKLGFVQTEGGALPGGRSRVVRELLGRGLLHDHITAGASFGGADGDAISVAGALHHGLTDRGWDGAVCGPGPGILGSTSTFGHGGMVAMDSSHAAIALGCPVVLCARMSEGDPRPRHVGISHHTRTVLRMLLAPVTVALPEGNVPGDELRHGTRELHDWRSLAADVEGYRDSGLPARTMGRSLDEDQVFFAAALVCGTALAGSMAP